MSDLRPLHVVDADGVLIISISRFSSDEDVLAHSRVAVVVPDAHNLCLQSAVKVKPIIQPIVLAVENELVGVLVVADDPGIAIGLAVDAWVVVGSRSFARSVGGFVVAVDEVDDFDFALAVRAGRHCAGIDTA